MSQNNQSILIKRYTLLAIGSVLLLALLAPLGSYIVWIFGGITTYFVFLAVYYSPRKINTGFKTPNASRDPTWTQTQTKSSPLFAHQRRQVVFVIFGISALVIIVAFIFAIIGIFQSDETDFISDTDRQTLTSDPNNLDALTNLGNQFYSNQQYDSALYYYNRVLEVDAQNSSGLYNKGLVLYQKQDYDQAVIALRKCISLYPDYGEAHALIGDNYYVQDKYSEALVWYRNAYDKGASSPEMLNILGFLYEQQQNTTEAARFYKETLRLDSSLVEVYNRLAVLEPGQARKYTSLAEKWK